MGGPSSEREISLKSGAAVLESLQGAGVDAVAVDIKTDDVRQNSSLIRSLNIDCAFLALHGRFGEDGQIQKLLEDLKILYTCSGVLASKLAMDKIASRRIFEKNGLHVPKYKVLEKTSGDGDIQKPDNFNFPVVVKPASHGSSIGLSIVDEEKALPTALDLAFSYDERIIVEEYISGREITVGILDNKALPVIEIVPKKRFFDYEAKYQAGKTDYILPAQLPEGIAVKAQSDALFAHKLLGCAGCSRADMILGKNNLDYILEINTIPGLTKTSLLPKAARFVGIEFSQMCLKLIELAYEKA